MQSDKKMIFKKTILNIIKLIKQEKKLQIKGFVFSIFTIIFSISSSYTLKILVDDVLIAKNHKLLWPIQFVFVLLVFGQTLFSILKSKVFNHASSKILLRLRSKILDTILNCNISKLKENFIGDSISTINYDVDMLDSVLSDGIPNFFSSILSVIITSIVMIYLDFRLAVITLPVVPIIIIVFSSLQNSIRKHAEKVQNSRGTMNGVIHELFNGLVTVKALNIQPEANEKFINSVSNMQESLLKQKMLYIIMGLSSWTMIMVPYQAIMYGIAGEWYFKTGTPSIGLMLTFANFANTLIGPVISIVQFFRDLSYSSVCFERIEELTTLEIEESGKELIGKHANYEFSFENIEFSYDKKNILIKNFNTFIPENKITVLLGKSGIGKSTILKLLFKLEKQSKGSIKFGNIDIKNINTNNYRDIVAYVPQNPFMFSGSIRFNLLLGNKNVTEKDIKLILEQCCLTEFIESLPYGIDSPIGENGKFISGGQKQRIALAQALLRDCKVIILDEPTSSLDSKNQFEIFKTLNNLKQTHTIIVSTHEKSFIKFADHVINLDYELLK